MPLGSQFFHRGIGAERFGSPRSVDCSKSRQSHASQSRGGAQRGIVINASTDSKVQKNNFHGLRTDGIDIIGHRVLVENNVFQSMSPLPGDHPDAVQMWSANNEQTRDVTVRGNVINGAMQGVFEGSATLGMSNIVVTDNKITIDYPNGIALSDLLGAMVKGNSVKSTTKGQFSKTNVRVMGSDVVACGNSVPDVPSAVANRPCGS